MKKKIVNTSIISFLLLVVLIFPLIIFFSTPNNSEKSDFEIFRDKINYFDKNYSTVEEGFLEEDYKDIDFINYTGNEFKEEYEDSDETLIKDSYINLTSGTTEHYIFLETNKIIIQDSIIKTDIEDLTFTKFTGDYEIVIKNSIVIPLFSLTTNSKITNLEIEHSNINLINDIDVINFDINWAYRINGLKDLPDSWFEEPVELTNGIISYSFVKTNNLMEVV